MGVSAAIMMGTAAVTGAYTQGEATKMQAKYAEQQGEVNAKLAEAQAKDALERGDTEAANVRKKGKLLQGSQRAAMAAQGIELSGTAGDILQETQEMSAQDMLTVKNNAYREAWGLRVEASSQRAQGRIGMIGARYSARQTLLTGGMQAAGYGAEAYGKEQASKKKTT